jgi:hypothetical protein
MAAQNRKAAVTALSRSGRSAEVEANRKIREVYNISRALVDKALWSRVESPTALTYMVGASGRRLPLATFARGSLLRASQTQLRARNARAVKRGLPGAVQVEIVRGAPKTLPRTFVTTVGAGHTGIFERFGEKVFARRGRYAGTGIRRQRIREVYGISVARMLNNRNVRQAAWARFREQFPKVFLHELWRRSSAGN